MVRAYSTIGEFFGPRNVRFTMANPTRQLIRRRITAYPNNVPALTRQRDLVARSALLVVGKRQWYLVMICADGVKRSFGEGTRVEFSPLTAAV